MALVHYGDGTLYGDVGAFYGRVSADLAEAQITQFRETGLQVRVIDERVNQWEDVNTVGSIDGRLLNDNNDTRTPGYWGYRGFSHVVKLADDTIVRVRVGNPADAADRQVYVQEITDPSVAAQWQSWTLLYSGTHYAAVILPTGASSYDVYHIKEGAGLCKNNSVLWSTATDGYALDDGIRIEMPNISTAPRMMYITITKAYPSWRESNALRVFDLYFTSDADANQPAPSIHNFAWTRNTIQVVEDPTDPNFWLIYRSFQLHNNPRLQENGESLTVSRVPAGQTEEVRAGQNAPQIIRGLPSQAGHHTINLSTTHMGSDGYLYLFFYEVHTDGNWGSIQNQFFQFWQRSKDGIHFSEPVITGASMFITAGAVEFEHAGEPYLYLCGNGSVIRRPFSPVEYELDNYVPQVSFELPRENQEGSGQVLVANPSGINDFLDSLSDARIHIKPGINIGAGNYEFHEFGDFWIKRPQRTIDGEINRIQLEIGDIWTRLQENFRDTINIVGQTLWSDWWGTGHPYGNNGMSPLELFHYYFEDGEGSVVEDHKLQVSGGVFLWSGWKGHNATWSFWFDGGACTFYGRYVDVNNHLRFDYSGTTVTVTSVIEGGSTVVGTFTPGAGLNEFYVEMRWGYIRIQTGQTLVGELTLVDPPIGMGYVGWDAGTIGLTIYNFAFHDWEIDITSNSLIRAMLATGDYHDAVVGGAESRQFALVWGPQTDIPSPADALRQLLEAEKLALVWRDGIIEIGQFKDTSPLRTLQDEIISSDFVEEAPRQFNLVIVDGNEHSWFEVDSADTRQRDRQIVGYFDIPELLTQVDVTRRTQEELRRSKAGRSPGAEIPLQFDLWRMDPITIVDNSGVERLVRIEGMSVDINQSTTPHQRQTLDTSLIL